MTPTSSSLERLRPQLRIIESATWIIWASVFLYALLGDIQPERRLPVQILLGVAAVYLYLLFHLLLERFFDSRWFHYVQLTVFGALTFIAIHLIDAVAPLGDLIMVLGVLLSVMLGGWGLSAYVAVMCALIATESLDPASLALISFSFVARLIIYFTVAFAVRGRIFGSSVSS